MKLQIAYFLLLAFVVMEISCHQSSKGKKNQSLEKELSEVADSLFDHDDYRRALSLYDSLIQLNPADPKIFFPPGLYKKCYFRRLLSCLSDFLKALNVTRGN